MTEKREWWQDVFGEKYLKTYADIVTDDRAKIETDFLIEFVGPAASDRILDVACGHGRHANALAARGYTVTGIDQASSYIDIAKKNASDLATPPTFAVADMRSLPFGGTEFDFIINMYTSFGYFDNESDNERVLAEIHRVLTNGGKFVLDLSNVYKRAVDFMDIMGEKVTMSVSNGLEVHATENFDPIASRWHSHVEWVEDGKDMSYDSNVRLFTPVEISSLLKKSGLTPVRFFGDFDGSQYRLESPRMIVVAEK